MNQVVLSACIVEAKPLRYTPAGVPALDLTLEHQSELTEAGSKRQVQATIRAVALGPLAGLVARQAIGSAGRFSGFLSSRRNSKSTVLHIQEFSPD